MIDALDALDVGQHAAQCEMGDYAESWRGSIRLAPDAEPAPAANAAE
jgi:hypothetical protein